MGVPRPSFKVFKEEALKSTQAGLSGAKRIGLSAVTNFPGVDDLQDFAEQIAARAGGIASTTILGAIKVSRAPQDPDSPIAIEVSEKGSQGGVAPLNTNTPPTIPSEYMPPAGGGAVSASDLADATDPIRGDALVGYKRGSGADPLETTVHAALLANLLPTPFDYKVKGNAFTLTASTTAASADITVTGSLNDFEVGDEVIVPMDTSANLGTTLNEDLRTKINAITGTGPWTVTLNAPATATLASTPVYHDAVPAINRCLAANNRVYLAPIAGGYAYSMDSIITLFSDTHIKGSSKAGALHLMGRFRNGGAFITSSTTTGVDNVTVEDLAIFGNRQRFGLTGEVAARCINVVSTVNTEKCFDLTIRNNEIYDYPGIAFQVHNAERCHILNNRVHNAYRGDHHALSDEEGNHR